MIPLPLAPRIIEKTGNRAVFEIEALYPGYGHTIGNGLRRVLLSSLRGAVITSFKMEGVKHEFSAMEGIQEDAIEIMLNLKQLRFRMPGEEPVVITLTAKGDKSVTARDFKIPSPAELITPDAHIATLTKKDARLEIEAVVESGLGYVPAEARTKEKVGVGTVALDASFSPVRYVNYEVDNMRVGDRTDYNTVRLTIETDGSLTPEDAFQRAALILVEQFQILTERVVAPDMPERAAKIPTREKTDTREPEPEKAAEETDTAKIKLEDLKISPRVLKVLSDAGIKTVGGIARKREETLRELDGVGDKAIQEIKKALGHLGVTLKQ
ncbi:MAG: DNA-directed RNA polymerase subunit alpha [Patescibacteria group bacterium]